jgi:flagellar basal-body rod modification protein FlgD
MTTVNSTLPTISPDLLATVNPKSATAVDPNSVQAQTDKFMTLLVTQLKNQDPTAPLDNAQITSQLAQLSTVTGINNLNTTLTSLQSSYQSSEAMQATSMIGHGVLVPGTSVQLQAGKSILGVDLATAADSVQVIVTDPVTGKDVSTINLGAKAAGTYPLAWDGVPDGGTTALADGNYSFRVVATKSGAALTDATALAFDTVASVTTSATAGVKLNLPTKGAVAMTDVKQIL